MERRSVDGPPSDGPNGVAPRGVRRSADRKLRRVRPAADPLIDIVKRVRTRDAFRHGEGASVPEPGGKASHGRLAAMAPRSRCKLK